MKQMDWGSAEEFVRLGNLGTAEVADDVDAFVIIAPQNVTGHSVLPLLEEMTTEAEKSGKTIIIVNAKLGDIPSSAGIMGVRGRQGRQDYIKTFHTAYYFRLLYIGSGPYPIMGALRHTCGGPWEVLKRVDFVVGGGGDGNSGTTKAERYEVVGSFESHPDATLITECFKRTAASTI